MMKGIVRRQGKYWDKNSGIVFSEAAGRGTVMGSLTLLKYDLEVGFARIEILLIQDPFWGFLHLTP